MGAPRITTVVRRVIRAARADARWSPAHELTGVLAVKIATQLEAATGGAEVVRLTRELRALMALLPQGVPAPVPPDDEGGADDDEGDPIDRELAEIVGTGPTVGDTSHA